jgi:hypothetical protein
MQGEHDLAVFLSGCETVQWHSIHSGHNTFWPVNCAGGRLGVSHLSNSIIIFHCLPLGS